MPREMIQSPVGPYHVKVGWRTDSHVQVGVEADEGRSIFWLLFDNEDREALGVAVQALALPPSERERRLAEALRTVCGRIAYMSGRMDESVVAEADTLAKLAADVLDTEEPAQDHAIAHAIGEAVLNILDSVVSDADDGPSGPAPQTGHGSYMGLWSTLDREGVNRLVRVLRRARDAAFGRDE